MMSVPLIATHFTPDLNPVSGYSIITLVMCSAIAVLLGQRFFRGTLFRQVAAVVSAIFVVAWIFLSMKGRRHVEADEYAVFAVCAAFGFGYGLSATRGPSLFVASVSLIATATAMFVIGAFLSGCVDVMLSEHASCRPYLPDWMALVTGLFFAINWALISIWLIPRTHTQFVLSRRLAEGCCPACDYDLRGSIGQSLCPECGEAIPWGVLQLPDAAG